MNKPQPHSTAPDLSEKVGNSLIQHGKSNDRIYLMKLSEADFPDIIKALETLANRHQYSKIFAKVPAWAKEGFAAAGYTVEAHVPGFFSGTVDAFFMSQFRDEGRAVQADRDLIHDVLQRAKGTPALTAPPALEPHFSCRVVTPDETESLATVYREVFETYPFPIHDPAFLKRAMDDNTVYFALQDGERIAAAASCEMDVSSLNVEMTDFATLPAYRSQGLASFLLDAMEKEMNKRGILTAYTIARAASYGMNITFAKRGYAFSGTLTNNTNISGGLESMNVWYKRLEPAI